MPLSFSLLCTVVGFVVGFVVVVFVVVMVVVRIEVLSTSGWSHVVRLSRLARQTHVCTTASSLVSLSEIRTTAQASPYRWHVELL